MNVDSIRESVSQAYAKAITKKVPSCCNFIRSCCGTRSADSNKAAGIAGYDDVEISSHQEAAASSFGCGNPLAFSDVKKGDVVLDLGSGAGFDLLIASEKVGPEGLVIGVDMTDEMIEKAEQNIKSTGVTNTEIRKGIIEQIPVSDSSVDWVISNCVINLSPEKHKVFDEIFRVLKPGGRMLVSDIVMEDLPPQLREAEYLYNSCVSGAISEEDYLAGLTSAGLEDVEIKERLIYEAVHIQSFLDNDQAGLIALFGELTDKETDILVNNLIEEATGKVWSAKFSARKPKIKP